MDTIYWISMSDKILTTLKGFDIGYITTMPLCSSSLLGSLAFLGDTDNGSM